MSTVIFLRNRAFSRTVGLGDGVPLTLLSSDVPYASGFKVFGCISFAKSQATSNLAAKYFLGVFVGYPPNYI
jgi:hypothetical protein